MGLEGLDQRNQLADSVPLMRAVDVWLHEADEDVSG